MGLEDLFDFVRGADVSAAHYVRVVSLHCVCYWGAEGMLEFEC